MKFRGSREAFFFLFPSFPLLLVEFRLRRARSHRSLLRKLIGHHGNFASFPWFSRSSSASISERENSSKIYIQYRCVYCVRCVLTVKASLSSSAPVSLLHCLPHASMNIIFSKGQLGELMENTRFRGEEREGDQPASFIQ